MAACDGPIPTASHQLPPSQPTATKHINTSGDVVLVSSNAAVVEGATVSTDKQPACKSAGCTKCKEAGCKEGASPESGAANVQTTTLASESGNTQDSEEIVSETDAEPTDQLSDATHQQSGTLTVEGDDGTTYPVQNFCVDKHGNVVVVASSQNAEHPGVLAVFDHTGKQNALVEMDVMLTAIAAHSDGSFFTAGGGKVFQVNLKGEILNESGVPGVKSAEEMQAEMKATAEAAWKKQKVMMQSAMDQMQQQIDSLQEEVAGWETTADTGEESEEVAEGTDEDAEADSTQELTDSEKQVREMTRRRLATYQQMFDRYAERMNGTPPVPNVSRAAASAQNVYSIACTQQHVFTVCRGSGYEIWRTDTDLSNPQKVKTGLSGCCGQMNISAQDNHLLVALNTKFKVDVMDAVGSAKRCQAVTGRIHH
ncbi:MAG: hypothetical protein AAFP69_16780, partial [Planctomycetota bacterium]